MGGMENKNDWCQHKARIAARWGVFVKIICVVIFSTKCVRTDMKAYIYLLYIPEIAIAKLAVVEYLSLPTLTSTQILLFDMPHSMLQVLLVFIQNVFQG